MIIDCGSFLLNSDQVVRFFIEPEMDYQRDNGCLKANETGRFAVKADINDGADIEMAIYDSRQDAEKAMAELLDAFADCWEVFTMPEAGGKDDGQTD
jgi:hypothetical protein